MRAFKKDKKFSHWSFQEDLHYYFYLILKFELFKDSKRSSKVFKEMNRFIPNRNAVQCRSHHQKKLNELLSQERVVGKFYKHYYMDRMLGKAHLQFEIKHFLEDARTRERITPGEFLDLELDLEKILKKDQLFIWEESPKQAQSNQDFQICSQKLEKTCYSKENSTERQSQGGPLSYEEPRDKMEIFYDQREDSIFFEVGFSGL